MHRKPVGVRAFTCLSRLAITSGASVAATLAILTAILTPGPAAAGEVVQKLTPVVQLAVQGTTRTHFTFVGFCDTCDFDQLRVVSRQIAIYTNHTLHADDAFNELSHPGAFAQTVSGLGSPQRFAQLEQDILAADLATQEEGCSVPIVYQSVQAPFDVTTTLPHDYVLTWYGAGQTLRTLHLKHGGPECSVELRRVILDILALEQEVIGDTPKVNAQAAAAATD